MSMSFERRFKVLGLIIVVITLIYIAVLAFTTVHSADDYWYSTFMDQGVGEYFELLKEHYKSFNGRVFVHVIAQLILHFGNIFFCGTCVFLCAFLPFLICKTEKLDERQSMILFCLFLIGFILMPISILREGVMWVSAFCNYFLPTVMICGQIGLLKYLQNNQKPNHGLYYFQFVFSFLCGATNEQMGLISVLIGLIFAVDAFITKQKHCFLFFLSAICSLIGGLTIFLSPATQNRLVNETHSNGIGNFISKIVSNFTKAVDILTQNAVVAVVLILLLLCTGNFLFRKTEKRVYLVISVICCLQFLIMPFLPIKAITLMYALVFLVLVINSVMLFVMQNKTPAVLLLSALGSVVIMLPTNTFESRIALPFYLLITACAALLIAQQTDGYKKFYLLLAFSLLIAGMLLYGIPTLSAYVYNYRIDRINMAHANAYPQTGILYYCMDYDMNYTHGKAFSDGFYYNKYIESIGYSADTVKIYFYQSDSPIVYCNNKRTSFPAVKNENGIYLLPLRDIVESLGGTVDWSDGFIVVTVNDRSYFINEQYSWAIVNWIDETGQDMTQTIACSEGLSSLCLDEVFYSEILGLSIHRDEAFHITLSTSNGGIK